MSYTNFDIRKGWKVKVGNMRSGHCVVEIKFIDSSSWFSDEYHQHHAFGDIVEIYKPDTHPEYYL